MTIDDVRAAMASWCLPAAQAAQLRALLDDHAAMTAKLEAALDVLNTPMEQHHAADMRDAAREKERLRAEVERLTLERDALAVEVSTLPYPSDLAEVTADRDRLAATSEAACRDRDGRIAALVLDRDRLAAALAEVREAAEGVRRWLDAEIDVDEESEDRAMVPFRRALASAPTDLAAAHDARVRAEALRDVACAFDRLAMMARKPGLVSRYTEVAARVRAEAERIGGGR